ncbi:Type I restriction-modification system, specificity subunit S [methanotrophic endosymbiont of Bathymodiolus azoricus (Menez Gwen)]|jgi:type I restriction enzyme S subunit|nr:Type I restriction-modification system, specificity subunit S [methanotrophic endosymbiont of Bathymodiolus azoricus (Menez Gwen)]
MIQEVYRRYEDYKKTDSLWYDETPNHWQTGRVKDFVVFNTTIKTPINFDENSLVEFVPMTNVDDELGKIKEFNFVPLKEVSSGYTKFRNGDVIFAKITPCMENGNSAIVAGLKHNICFGSTEFMVFRASRKLTNKYLRYFLHNELFRRNAEPFMKGTAGQKRIGSHYMAIHFFSLPPIPEQKSIADYLDTKTTQIDKKVHLLTQKSAHYSKLKQSLINETVTRGLDKTVPMKDSGIEWIGDIPEHWGVSAITNITSTISIKNHPKEELLSVYRDYGVIIKSMRDDNHNKAGANLSNYKLVEAGYLVINKMKAWQGSLGVSEFRGIVSPAYITCKTDKKIVERSYLHHLLRCRNYINEYNRLSYGVRVDQWDMRYDDFKYVPVLLPPKKEQKSIADYLDDKTAKIDTIVKTINTQIEHLKELRKTLINDVVTGQIKVI